LAAVIIIHRALFSTLRGFGKSPKAAISDNRLDIIMPHFHFPLLTAMAHDAELSLAGNAVLVILMGDRCDRSLFASLLPD